MQNVKATFYLAPNWKNSTGNDNNNLKMHEQNVRVLYTPDLVSFLVVSSQA